MDSEIFRKLPPTKLFFRCAVPSMVTMAFASLYQIADGLFVGRFVGGDALAAINLIMPIIMIVFGFANLIATGASVRVSVLLGAKNREDASQVFTFTLKFLFMVSCVLGFLGLVFAENFVRFLAPGASELAIEYGITYTRVYAAFAPLMLIFHATDNYLRACGKEKLSMWLGIGTQTLNILLDVILIVFLGQGVWAAAFTSCLSMALGSVITLWLFRGKHMDLYYTKSKIQVCGTTAVAAFSVIMYVDSFVGMFLFGMADSLQPAISYCYGAGLMDKVKAIFRCIILGAVALSVASLLFMMFAGQYVAPLFVKQEDPELLNVSIIGMKLFSLSYLTGWVDMCFSSYFTALERPGRSLLTSFLGTLVFPIGALFLLTPTWELDGVWLSAVTSCTVSAVFTIMLYLTMTKRNDIQAC